MPDFLTRKVAGKIPVWVLIVAALALGLYLRYRSRSNPAATAEPDPGIPDFTNTSGNAGWSYAQPPQGSVPIVIAVDVSPANPAQPVPGGGGPSDAPPPGAIDTMPPPVEAPPVVGGGPSSIPQAVHDAPPAPPVYHPPDQPNGYVPGPGPFPAPYWAPAPTPVDPVTGAIARDRNVEGL